MESMATESVSPIESDRALLLSALGYVIGKLLTANDESAHALLDSLRHQSLVVDGADVAEGVSSASGDIGASLERFGAAIWDGEHEQGVQELRAALAAWIALLEGGGLKEGARVAEEALRGLLASGRWDPKALLGLVVAGVVTAETGDRPLLGMHSRIKLHCDTNSRFNSALNWLVGRKRPARKVSVTPCMLNVHRSEVLADVVENLRSEGYHVFPGALSEECIARLTDFALQAPGRPEPLALVPEQFRGAHSSEGQRLRLPEIKGSMAGFWCDQQAVLDLQVVQKLLCEPSYLAIAREYLGTEPIFATVNLWWSFPVGDQDECESSMGQQFHFDADWNHSLRFFHYLTDVDVGDGPHAYVRGSHKPGGIPQDLLDRGYARISDEELHARFSAEDVVLALAPRGSILAGDPQSLHRGNRPTAQPRLMLEFLFTDTAVSGVPKGDYKVRRGYHPEYRRMVAELPDVFRFQTLEA